MSRMLGPIVRDGGPCVFWEGPAVRQRRKNPAGALSSSVEEEVLPPLQPSLFSLDCEPRCTYIFCFTRVEKKRGGSRHQARMKA